VRYLVTGGTSPVGAALARKLAAGGHAVRILSRGRDHRRLAGLDGTIIGGDVRDAAAVTAAAEGCDGIVHAAYAPAGAPARETLDVAVNGALAVLGACGKHAVRELLLVSSPLAADPRPGPYGLGKLAAEAMAAASVPVPPRLVIARPYNVYGPDCGHHHVIPQLIARMRRLAREHPRGVIPFPVMGDGTEVRSFIYVDDCAERLAALPRLRNYPGYCTEDVGTTDLRTIASVARDIAACLGRQIEIVPTPLPPGVPHRRVPAGGFPPETPFAEGLARTVAWYREHDPEVPDD
jgi:nucleoside-diphosphate-sugar epimerase